ncbi:MAG: sulfite exporter TauE/SafE family protein [Bacteroidia bacterium]
MPLTDLIHLGLLFFAVATLYSMVGFGGGSSYLAILTFYMADQYLIRSNALICNIAVVSIGTITALLDKSLQLKKAVLYVALSIPAAYLGAMVRLSDKNFFILLAIALLLSSIGMVLQSLLKKVEEQPIKKSSIQPLGIGGLIGFFSGMVGIGGGIFLSPMVNLLKMETAKTIAGIASFFILVNSIAGILGLAQTGKLNIEPNTTIVLVATVFIGGFVGARIKSSKLKSNHIRLLTAILVFMVGIRLLVKYI